MNDLRARLEKLLIDAEDCDLIGRLATDATKRETFRKVAAQLRAAAAEIEAAIAQTVSHQERHSPLHSLSKAARLKHGIIPIASI